MSAQGCSPKERSAANYPGCKVKMCSTPTGLWNTPTHAHYFVKRTVGGFRKNTGCFSPLCRVPSGMRTNCERGRMAEPTLGMMTLDFGIGLKGLMKTYSNTHLALPIQPPSRLTV